MLQARWSMLASFVVSTVACSVQSLPPQVDVGAAKDTVATEAGGSAGGGDSSDMPLGDGAADGAFGSGGAMGGGGNTGNGGTNGVGGLGGIGGSDRGSGGIGAAGGTTGTGGIGATGGTTRPGPEPGPEPRPEPGREEGPEPAPEPPPEAPDAALDTAKETGPVASCTGMPDFTPCTTATAPDRHYDICVSGACVSPGCGGVSCNVPGPHFPLADTGLRVCYDGSKQLVCPASTASFFGQDAQYGWDVSHAPSERYTRSASVPNQPVVLDNVTGLAWQGCQAGLTGTACAVGVVATHTWESAVAYCDALDWGGHQDWYLPDPYELHSLADLGRTNPAIDVSAFPATSSDKSWTSSSFAGDVLSAYSVYFLGGDVVYRPKSDKHAVRCARGDHPIVGAGWTRQTRFSRDTSVLGQAVVLDAATGLGWQGCTAGLEGNDCATGEIKTYSWKDALAYCEGLSWGGHTDWRVPNMKELRTIVDETRTYPSIDTIAFPGTGSDYYWPSSTLLGEAGPYSWAVGFHIGSVDTLDKTYLERVRCVRGGQ